MFHLGQLLSRILLVLIKDFYDIGSVYCTLNFFKLKLENKFVNCKDVAVLMLHCFIV